MDQEFTREAVKLWLTGALVIALLYAVFIFADKFGIEWLLRKTLEWSIYGMYLVFGPLFVGWAVRRMYETWKEEMFGGDRNEEGEREGDRE